MQDLRPQNGPPLSMARKLPRNVQLQSVHVVSDLHLRILPSLFRS